MRRRSLSKHYAIFVLWTSCAAFYLLTLAMCFGVRGDVVLGSLYHLCILSFARYPLQLLLEKNLHGVDVGFGKFNISRCAHDITRNQVCS